MSQSEMNQAAEQPVLNAPTSLTATNDFFAERPQFAEEYIPEENVIVRMVAPAKANAKPYKITGIEDTESKNNWKAWIYLAPVIVLLVIFLLYPLINTIAISFLSNYDYVSGSFDGFTLDNFGVILGLVEYNGAIEPNFLPYALPNTLILVFITVPISTLMALLISVALNQLPFFKKFLQTVFFLPYVTNTMAIGMVFSVMFDDKGIINYLFKLDNFHWINGASRWVAMIPLCIYIIWSALPFKILVFLSGLQGIDQQYYNAAKIDGAGSGKILWRVTVPLMSPQILYILVTAFIGAFKEYSAVVALFNGASTTSGSATKELYTIVYYIYDKLSTQTSLAAAAAVLLFVIILAFTGLQMAVSKKRVYY